jgi:stage III sporulation protein AG
MKSLIEWLRDREWKASHIIMALAAGVLFMLLGRSLPFSGRVQQMPPEEPSYTASEPLKLLSAERELEKRLEEAFSLVENVGKVRVLLSFTNERETVYASDANTSESYTRETDSQGGTRETRSQSSQEKTITITDRAGVDRPLVLREIEPRIVGVVIIAEGGDSVFVRDALTKAACTVLGIEANKVQVFKMSEH